MEGSSLIFDVPQLHHTELPSPDGSELPSIPSSPAGSDLRTRKQEESGLISGLFQFTKIQRFRGRQKTTPVYHGSIQQRILGLFSTIINFFRSLCPPEVNKKRHNIAPNNVITVDFSPESRIDIHDLGRDEIVKPEYYPVFGFTGTFADGNNFFFPSIKKKVIKNVGDR